MKTKLPFQLQQQRATAHGVARGPWRAAAYSSGSINDLKKYTLSTSLVNFRIVETGTGKVVWSDAPQDK